MTDKKYKIGIEIKSPLLVCSGETLSFGIDYLFHKDRVYRINFSKMINKIPKEEINDLANKLLEQKNFSINNVLEKYVDDEITDYVIDFYNDDMNKYSNKDIMNYEVKEMVKSIVYKNGEKKICSYIPGSSIKGALRNFIELFKDNMNYDNLFNQKLRKILENIKRKKDTRRNKNELKEITNELDKHIKKFEEKNRIKLFSKFVVKDSSLSSDIFLSRIKTITTKNNNLNRLTIIGELLKPNLELTTDITIKEPFLFNIRINNYEFELKELFKKINDYSEKYIYSEKQYYKKIGSSQISNDNKDNLINFYKELEEEIQTLDSGKSCIMKVGFGSSKKFTSLESKTYIIKDKNNLENIRTRKLVYYKLNNKFGYYPMGWVKLSILE